MSLDTLLSPELRALYLQGLSITLKLFLPALLLATLLALPLALLRASRLGWVAGPIGLFTCLVRGTPLLVQVYLIYFGLAQLEWLQRLWHTVWPWIYFREAFFCAAFAFTLNCTAHCTELWANSLRARTEPGIAAALLRAVPDYRREVIALLHGTALASALPALTDLTGAANKAYALNYLPFQAYLPAALVYLALTLTIAYAFMLVERLSGTGARPQSGW